MAGCSRRNQSFWSSSSFLIIVIILLLYSAEHHEEDNNAFLAKDMWGWSILSVSSTISRIGIGKEHLMMFRMIKGGKYDMRCVLSWEERENSLLTRCWFTSLSPSFWLSISLGSNTASVEAPASVSAESAGGKKFGKEKEKERMGE